MKLIDQPGPTWDAYDITSSNQEHDLFESVVVEKNDIFGAEVYYYRVDGKEDLDTLYGENPNTYWESLRKTKATYQPTEELSVIESFGITSDETIQYMYIPVYTFRRDVLGDVSDITAPVAGDVIVTPWNTRNYEVVDVGLEDNIFQYGKFIYELILRPFRFSSQSSSAETITDTDPASAWGDNTWIETQSDTLSAYGDVDESVYGY